VSLPDASARSEARIASSPDHLDGERSGQVLHRVSDRAPAVARRHGLATTRRILLLAAAAALASGVSPASRAGDPPADAGAAIHEAPATLREAFDELLRVEHESESSPGWLERTRSALGDRTAEERAARIERLAARVRTGVEELRRERAERVLSKQEARLLDRIERWASRGGLAIASADPANAAPGARPRRTTVDPAEVARRDERPAASEAVTPDVAAAPEAPIEPALGGMSFSLLVFGLGVVDSAISGLRARRPRSRARRPRSIASRRSAGRSSAAVLSGGVSKERSGGAPGRFGRGAAGPKREAAVPGAIPPTTAGAGRHNGHRGPSWTELGPALPAKRPNGFGFPICTVCGIPVVRIAAGEYGLVSVDGIADRLCPECTRELMHPLLEKDHRVGIRPL
jgi:hypothetical protein